MKYAKWDMTFTPNRTYIVLLDKNGEELCKLDFVEVIEEGLERAWGHTKEE